MTIHIRRRAVSSMLGAAVVAVIAVTGLAGCSGSGTPGSTSSGAAGGPTDIATATSDLAAGQGAVTWNGPTDPVTPPAAGSLWVISCDESLEGCKREAAGAIAAGQALGWQTHEVNITDPSKFDEAVSQAVAAGATAIILPSVDQSFIKNGLAKAKAAHIPVVSLMQGNVPGPDGVDADVTPTGKEMGDLLAATAVVQFGDKPIDLLPYVDNEYAYSAAMVTEMAARVAELCPSCTVEQPVQFTSTQVASQLPTTIVAALQRNPNINAIALPYDPAAQFAVPAIVNAGLGDRVKIYSQVGNSVNIGLIQKGTVQAATIGNPSEWAGWAAVDEALRVLAGQPTVDENLPIRSITQDHIPAGGVFNGEEAGYEAQYKALWGLS